MRAEQLTPACAQHGEGPVWLSGAGWPDGLYWVDLLAGDVLSLNSSGEVQRRHVAPVVAVLRPRARGGLLYAVQRGIAVDDGPGSQVQTLPEIWGDPNLRMNEGGCDPDGNFYCGSMAYDARVGAGKLYRLDPHGRWHIVESNWTIPNGLEWAPDGTTAYHCDTAAARIDVLDWDPDRGLHNRTPFVHVSGGGPDGLTIDIEGGVWVALWGGSAVHRYAPDGSLSEVVEVPCRQVSACTFGGDEGRDLYITTSREGLSEPEATAGAVFVAHPAVTGVAPRPYAG